MKYLLLLPLIASILFITYYWKKYGIQASISASIHVLTGALEKSYYSFFIVFIVFPVMIVASCTWGFIAGALLLTNAAAVSVSKKIDPIQSFLHVFGSMGGIAAAMIMLIVNFARWDLVLIYALFILYNYRNKCENKTTWIEVGALVVVLIGLVQS